MVEWAKHIPHFAELNIDDQVSEENIMKVLCLTFKCCCFQVSLLRGGWNELLIAGFAHRSVGIANGKSLFSNLRQIVIM